MQTLNGTCSSSSITKLISSSLYDIFFLSSSEVLRVIFVTIIWEFHLPFSYRLISTQCGVEKSTIFSLTQHRRHFQTNLISCQSFFWIAFSTIIIIPHQNIFSVVANLRIAIVSRSLIPEILNLRVDCISSVMTYSLMYQGLISLLETVLRPKTRGNISLNRRLGFWFEPSEELHSGYMNLFVQSVPNRSRKLIYQAEGGRYFKHKVIKDYHTKIPKPIQSAKLAHQVKLGNPWNAETSQT